MDKDWQDAAELRNDLQPLSHEEEDSLLSNETIIVIPLLKLLEASSISSVQQSFQIRLNMVLYRNDSYKQQRGKFPMTSFLVKSENRV